MLRIFLIVIAMGVLFGLGGMVYLGVYPPNPQIHQVEKTLPAANLGR